MKRTKALLLSLLLLISLLFGGCSDSITAQNEDIDNLNQSAIVSEIEENEEGQAEESSQNDENNEENNEDGQDVTTDSEVNNQSSAKLNQQTQPTPQMQKVFNVLDIPAYTSNAYVAINSNTPFTVDEYTTKSFERYSSLDSLGRCGVVFANVG